MKHFRIPDAIIAARHGVVLQLPYISSFEQHSPCLKDEHDDCVQLF